jgi:hypothetical protein
MRSTSFNDAVADHRDRIRAVRRIPFDFQIPRAKITLTDHREGNRHPTELYADAQVPKPVRFGVKVSFGPNSRPALWESCAKGRLS